MRIKTINNDHSANATKNQNVARTQKKNENTESAPQLCSEIVRILLSYIFTHFLRPSHAGTQFHNDETA